MNSNLYRYPQQAVLRDGRRVTLRPFAQGDVSALHDFFLRLPHELRSFAWDRVESRATIEAWGAGIDYAKVFPLLALDGSRIVGDATLHRREHGPLRLVGRLRWLIDPEFRAVGLGSILVNHLIDSARANGLRHLSCLLIRDLEADAIETLVELGFEARHIPRYGTDPDGGEHDMSLLVLRL
ncbi:MAG TPA: GNAT family N-acetyltransferase [Thermoanaerobaculia bacterium]|nr:GNAT family N-acetyltransferase [Thermoanaerobaculia bacterium]